MNRSLVAALMALTLTAPAASLDARTSRPPAAVEEVSAADLLARLRDGSVTSEALVRAYLDRIARLDRSGPALHAIISTNPDALAEAKRLDAERKAGKLRGPLHGLPILIKDNIETKDAMPTTAGSLALKDNRTGRDAPVVARLRLAGALILGKTNLSEWANIRSTNSSSGWSGIGGLVRNPYALDRTACGSSSGTGAAIAASLGAVGVGTETDGSIVCPSSMNGLVGLKPTVGLISRIHIVPISHSQDTAGPMGRSVRDVALLFASMVGRDMADPPTKDADAHIRDYAATLSPDALKGVRLGVVRPEMPAALTERFEAALAVLKGAGAILVDIKQPKLDGMDEAEFDVLKYELKAGLDVYLAKTPKSVKSRTLADVVAFNTAHADRELALFGQEIFEDAAKLGDLDSPDYIAARAKSLALAREAGLDVMLDGNNVAAIIEPSYGLPWLADPIAGDKYSGPSASSLPAIAGYPHLTVPMGLARGLPVGLSFIGRANSDGDLLRYGYAFEQAGNLRQPPRYLPTAPTGNLLDPVTP